MYYNEKDMEGKLVKLGEDDYILHVNNKPFAYKSLSLKNCEAIANGYDLDELAGEYANKELNVELTSKAGNFYGFSSSFKEGFQKALEILGDKKFSESNLRIGCSSLLNLEKEEGELSEVFTEKQYRHIDNYIQSLQHVECDVEIEMEPYVIGGNEDFVGDGETHIIETKLRPQLDVDGCLILKRK